jgi:hypothetical protein
VLKLLKAYWQVRGSVKAEESLVSALKWLNKAGLAEEA